MKSFITSSFLILLHTVLLSGQDKDYQLHEYKEHRAKVNTLVFDPSSAWLASGGEDKSIVLRPIGSDEPSLQLNDNYYPVKDIEFFGSDQLFISSGNDIKLINLKGETLALYQGSATNIWSVDYAPERNKITAGSFDRKVKVWDVGSTAIDLELVGHEKTVLVSVFSLDEKYLATGSRDQSIKIWNAQNGLLLHSFEKHSGNIYDLQYHPNTRYLASASDDKTIRLWDVEKKELIKTYIGHQGAVMDIDFSPDGFFLYSASIDGTVIIWEVATGQKIYSFVDHTGSVNALAVSADGLMLATAGDDGRVLLWKSAAVIVVEMLYNDSLSKEKSENPLFLPRQKGESKEIWQQRSQDARIAEKLLIEKYYQQYTESKNNKNIP